MQPIDRQLPPFGPTTSSPSRSTRLMALESDSDIEPDNSDLEVSVVIPAYLGARTISASLDSIERAIRHRSAEIIVVESSGDETCEIVRKRFPEVTLICSKTRLSAGGARNRGAAAAKGRLIFFTDQDCIVPVDWIDRLEGYFEDPAVGAAGGAVGICDPTNLSGCAVYFLEFLYHFPRHGSAAAKRKLPGRL